MLFGSRRNFESVGWEKGLALPGRSPWNRTTPTGPSPDVQAIVFLGFGEPTGSTASVQLVLGRRGPPPGCPRVERERPHTRGGFPDTAAALSSLRKCTFPPTPPLLVFIYPPFSHPPTPLQPTIRFLKSSFVSQEAGEREREGKGTQRQRAGAAASLWLTEAGDRRVFVGSGGGDCVSKTLSRSPRRGRETPAPGVQREHNLQAVDNLDPSGLVGRQADC